MALTSQQLVTLACQTARAPGYLVQVGDLLNQILSDLCQTYDMEAAKQAFLFNFSPTLTALVGPSIFGGGPYPLPADYLRAAGDKALTFFISGVAYNPKRIELDEFDQLVQISGNQNYPSLWTTDLSLADETEQGLTVPALYLYQPPSGAFPAQLRYYRQMPDIATPQTSAVVPWFPNSGYLLEKLTARAMDLARDPRAEAWHGRAEATLTKFLKMKDDPEGRAHRVHLDRRSYGPGNYDNLKNTKLTGW